MNLQKKLLQYAKSAKKIATAVNAMCAAQHQSNTMKTILVAEIIAFAAAADVMKRRQSAAVDLGPVLPLVRIIDSFYSV